MDTTKIKLNEYELVDYKVLWTTMGSGYGDFLKRLIYVSKGKKLKPYGVKIDLVNKYINTVIQSLRQK